MRKTAAFLTRMPMPRPMLTTSIQSQRHDKASIRKEKGSTQMATDLAHKTSHDVKVIPAWNYIQKHCFKGNAVLEILATTLF